MDTEINNQCAAVVEPKNKKPKCHYGINWRWNYWQTKIHV